MDEKGSETSGAVASYPNICESIVNKNCGVPPSNTTSSNDVLLSRLSNNKYIVFLPPTLHISEQCRSSPNSASYQAMYFLEKVWLILSQFFAMESNKPTLKKPSPGKKENWGRYNIAVCIGVGSYGTAYFRSFLIDYIASFCDGIN